jgi:hypothetical protein
MMPLNARANEAAWRRSRKANRKIVPPAISDIPNVAGSMRLASSHIRIMRHGGRQTLAVAGDFDNVHAGSPTVSRT